MLKRKIHKLQVLVRVFVREDLNNDPTFQHGTDGILDLDTW